MAVALSSMIDQMRLLLNDAADTQVAFTTKVLFLNSGLNAMFPSVYRVIRDTSVVLVANTFEYALPAAISSGILLSVELESGNATDDYIRLSYYDLIQGATQLSIIFTYPYAPSAVGARLRLTAAARLTRFVSGTYAASSSEFYTGPDGTENIPVYYAMSMITAAKVDDRQDTYIYNTLRAANGVDDQDIMQAHSLWMMQFERELALSGKPLPIARD